MPFRPDFSFWEDRSPIQTYFLVFENLYSFFVLFRRGKNLKVKHTSCLI